MNVVVTGASGFVGANLIRTLLAGVERVVYTSSVGTLGIPKDRGPGTETTPVSFDDMVGPHKRSEFLAERVAEEYASPARMLPHRGRQRYGNRTQYSSPFEEVT